MAVVAPSELYTDPELREQFKYGWKHRLPFQQMLTAADIIVGQEDPVAFLDGLETRDGRAWFEAERVITGLPPKTIFDNYGSEMLAWATVNAPSTDIVRRMQQGLAEHAGFDTSLFESARLWQGKVAYSSKGKPILRQYRFMENLLGGALARVNLQEILEQSVLPEVVEDMSEKRLNAYSLIPLRLGKEVAAPDGGPVEGWYDEEHEPGIICKIWLDAPTGFALAYKGRPNAVAGLALSGLNELMIYQLQGVHARRVDPKKKYLDNYEIGKVGARGLALFDWRKVLVDITSVLAKQNALSSIGIQSGERNKWTKETPHWGTEPHLDKKIAIKSYDVPANRLGFSKQRDGNWHRSLAV